MSSQSLLAISPVDGRYAARVESLRPITSEFGLIRARVLIECRWLEALIDGGLAVPSVDFDDAARVALLAVATGFSVEDAERVKTIERTTNHDVKAVEYFVRERTAGIPALADLGEMIHFACTSEDINSTAYALMLSEARSTVLLPTLARVREQLARFVLEWADVPMMSRTHGQPASPTSLGKELAVFVARLDQAVAEIAAVRAFGKMSGAVGNYNAHVAAFPEVDWPAFSAKFLASLGVEAHPCTTQIEPHDWIARLFDATSRANCVLIDLCRDLWGYVSLGYLRQRPVKGEIGSSTMPHKINPIDFENAEGNLGIANATLDHLARKLLTSRWQRDLTDSTALRNVGVGLAHSLVAWDSLLKGLGKISPDLELIAADLDHNWEVLAEPIQTVMRRYAVPNAYERLKELTRGQRLGQDAIRAFVATLEIPVEERERLLAMTPASYLGLAPQLARSVAR